MTGKKGKWNVWLGLVFALGVVPCVRAVLFKATGDPSYNTNAPTGSLTNSGWQYEGQWNTEAGDFLGTPIAPTFFLAAQHIGGSSGQPFVFNGFTYTTVTNFDDPSSDLRIWQVAETFPYYAPLYTQSNEVGKLCVVFGRGTQRGSAVMVNTTTNGWMWGATDNVERWGENMISGVYTDANNQLYLYATFDRNGITNECDLSVYDSSGGMFIENGTTWQLAGIHNSVSNPFVSTNGVNGSGFNAALMDYYHLYVGGDNNWQLVTQHESGAFFSTRVSARISWINTIINAPLMASFSGSPTNGSAPLTVTFTDSSTGPITNRFWNFGEGSTTNFALATNPTHTYTAGTYNVTLIVSGTGGASTNTKASYITVTPPPPVASFTASPTSGAAPLSVSFTDTSSGSITGWAWVFGDGNTSTSQNPTDIYVTPGTYTVQEILSGLGGSSTDTVANLISVYDPFAWWQLTYFGSTNNPVADPNADPDGDGMSNMAEFLTGTDPTNSTSAFRITSIAQVGTDLEVGWMMGPGKTNALERSLGDVDGNYSNNFTDIFTVTNTVGAVTNYLDLGAAINTPARYYRVRLVP